MHRRDNWWYGLDGQPITAEEANELLADREALRVALTQLPGGWRVSTVFLVLDHNMGIPANEGPVLWETMAFGDDMDDIVGPYRYTSRDAALAGHDQVVAGLREALAEVERITEGQSAPHESE